MPEQIRELLTDPSIVKVGSGMCCELEELLHVDNRFRGWVNSGAILGAFLFNHTRTWLEPPCSYLNQFGLKKGFSVHLLPALLGRIVACSQTWRLLQGVETAHHNECDSTICHLTCCSSEVHNRQEIERGNIGLPHSVWGPWSGSKWRLQRILSFFRMRCSRIGWPSLQSLQGGCTIRTWMIVWNWHTCIRQMLILSKSESGYSLEVKAKSTMRLFIDQDGEKFSHPNCWLRKTGLIETFL